MAANDNEISGPFYHGTKADLKPGDLIRPGYRSNYGHGERTSPWVYMTATLSPLGAELARGDGPGRLYVVEPTGPFVDDPDLTDKKFPGNPTRSYRSRYPLRVAVFAEGGDGVVQCLARSARRVRVIAASAQVLAARCTSPPCCCTSR